MITNYIIVQTESMGVDNFCWFLHSDNEKGIRFLLRMPSSILF